jgi:hypothetical protein
MYEVPDETYEYLSAGAVAQPPHIVLEVMAMNGQATKVGTVGTITQLGEGELVEEDEDGLPDDGSSLFDEDLEEDDDES